VDREQGHKRSERIGSVRVEAEERTVGHTTFALEFFRRVVLRGGVRRILDSNQLRFGPGVSSVDDGRELQAEGSWENADAGKAMPTSISPTNVARF
jgi:hypothetical protein